MGRYAFFNTGFEYKFVFTVQSSYDIREFGGKILSDTYIEWTQEDKNNPIFQLLVSEIDFNKYEKSLKGTQNLRHDLYDMELDCTYVLGCLIYHQLLYTEVLTCRYEL